MKTNTLPILVAALLLALSTSAAQAQAVYRVVGANGKVTYTDTPPPTGAASMGTGASAGSSVPGSQTLPYELQQVVNRYPVTLYSGNGCDACDTGRAMLRSRGIPFTEKTVTSNDDIKAFQQLNSVSTLPLLTIGSQHVKGFSSTEWSQFLDAAGYPKTSQLPGSYRATPALPLVIARPAEKPAETASSPATPSSRTRPSSSKSTTNPNGIQF